MLFHGVTKRQRGRFADQLDWLSNSFTFCSIQQGVQAVLRRTLDKPLVSLTFDDAEQTVCDIAMPILAERKIAACVYAVPTYLDRGVSYRASTPQPIMSWSQLTEWVSAGHEVGSHTYTHVRLNCCTPSRREQEVRYSQEVLQQRLGVPVRHFAYPWGCYNASIERAIAGSRCYETIATTWPGIMGYNMSPVRLRRDPLNPDHTPEQTEKRMRFNDRFCWLQSLRCAWSNARNARQVPREK